MKSTQIIGGILFLSSIFAGGIYLDLLGFCILLVAIFSIMLANYKYDYNKNEKSPLIKVVFDYGLHLKYEDGTTKKHFRNTSNNESNYGKWYTIISREKHFPKKEMQKNLERLYKCTQEISNPFIPKQYS